jgi:hypothetical protein
LRLATLRPGELDALTRALVSGSDTRLRVDEGTGLNGYGCQAFPRPAELSLSSSTASTISEPAYTAAEAAFRDLCERGGRPREEIFAARLEQVRHDIATLLDVSDADIVLAPSGTDAALLALCLARSVLDRPAVSIVVAAEETGSGVGLAASGRHFDSVTPAGRHVVKGEPIAELATEGLTVPIAMRDRHGEPLPAAEVDERVHQCVSAATASGNGVVLQVMNHSKTGGHYPSLKCVAEIIAQCSASVQVVVDACQARLSRARLRWYLDRGCMVLITGSKFFAGPPLSGALLIPARISARVAERGDVPAGLADYTTCYDWPASWRGMRSAAPKRMPVGQVLRWIAAVEEMRAYFAVPEFVRKLLLKEFGAAVLRLAAQYPHVRLAPNAYGDFAGEHHDDEFATPTIFPLIVTRGDRPLSVAQGRSLYRALNDDVSRLLRQPSQAEREVAARLCHVGQPIAIADGKGGMMGAIRISADARFVHQCWSHADRTIAVATMQRRFGAVRTVLDKVGLLLQSFDDVERAYAAP